VHLQRQLGCIRLRSFSHWTRFPNPGDPPAADPPPSPPPPPPLSTSPSFLFGVDDLSPPPALHGPMVHSEHLLSSWGSGSLLECPSVNLCFDLPRFGAFFFFLVFFLSRSLTVGLFPAVLLLFALPRAPFFFHPSRCLCRSGRPNCSTSFVTQDALAAMTLQPLVCAGLVAPLFSAPRSFFAAYCPPIAPPPPPPPPPLIFFDGLASCRRPSSPFPFPCGLPTFSILGFAF